MIWNKHAKLTATATSALLFTLLLASCANNNNSVPLPTNNQVQQEQLQNNDTEIKDQVDEVVEETIDDDKNSVEAEAKETLYHATGKYVGAIDGNSIEVMIDGQATVFQLDEQFEYVINEFNENAKVTIKYTKHSIDNSNYVQNIVNEIMIAK